MNHINQELKAHCLWVAYLLDEGRHQEAALYFLMHSNSVDWGKVFDAPEEYNLTSSKVDLIQSTASSLFQDFLALATYLDNKAHARDYDCAA